MRRAMKAQACALPAVRRLVAAYHSGELYRVPAPVPVLCVPRVDTRKATSSLQVIAFGSGTFPALSRPGESHPAMVARLLASPCNRLMLNDDDRRGLQSMPRPEQVCESNQPGQMCTARKWPAKTCASGLFPRWPYLRLGRLRHLIEELSPSALRYVPDDFKDIALIGHLGIVLAHPSRPMPRQCRLREVITAPIVASPQSGG